MPLVTALKSMKLAWVRPAMMRARVVFPTPGGPQKIMEEMRSSSNRSPQNFSLAQKVLLPDKFLQGARPHPAGQWPVHPLLSQ